MPDLAPQFPTSAARTPPGRTPSPAAPPLSPGSRRRRCADGEPGVHSACVPRSARHPRAAGRHHHRQQAAAAPRPRGSGVRAPPSPHVARPCTESRSMTLPTASRSRTCLWRPEKPLVFFVFLDKPHHRRPRSVGTCWRERTCQVGARAGGGGGSVSVVSLMCGAARCRERVRLFRRSSWLLLVGSLGLLSPPAGRVDCARHCARHCSRSCGRRRGALTGVVARGAQVVVALRGHG